jgi:Uma2 family endonuclease
VRFDQQNFVCGKIAGMIEREMTAELEEELKTELPEWIEREPQRWRQVQYALRKTATPNHVFDTFEAFIEWVDEDTSAEWVDGEVVFMSPASTRHQLIIGFLYKLVGFFVEKHSLGIVLNAPYKMKLLRYGPEPDLLFVANEHLDRVRETFLDGPADLVIEVISFESIGRDRGQKFIAYEAAGIPEYWLFDPDREVAEFYRLGPNGRYQLTPVADDGRYSSFVLPGFWLDVNWLWQVPLPPVLDVLRQLKVL